MHKKLSIISSFASDIPLLLDLIDKYGVEHQIKKAIEELTELSLELQHFGRDRNRYKIIEEMSDVSIVLDQLAIIFGGIESIGRIRNNKLSRALSQGGPT